MKYGYMFLQIFESRGRTMEERKLVSDIHTSYSISIRLLLVFTHLLEVPAQGLGDNHLFQNQCHGVNH